MLVNLSLDTWAKEKKLEVKKLTGNLDYNKLRTPKTELTQEELDYCIHDVLVMYSGLKEYKEKYEHIIEIPLTQTGEVRRECIKIFKDEYKYRKRTIYQNFKSGQIKNPYDKSKEAYTFEMNCYCSGSYDD